MKKVKLIDLSTVISPGMPKPKSAPPVLLRYILEPSEEQEKAQGFTNKMEEYTMMPRPISPRTEKILMSMM